MARLPPVAPASPGKRIAAYDELRLADALHLEPVRAPPTGQVGAGLLLGHYAFQAVLAGRLEEGGPVPIHEVADLGHVAGPDYLVQAALPAVQGLGHDRTALQVEEVEGDEVYRVFPLARAACRAPSRLWSRGKLGRPSESRHTNSPSSTTFWAPTWPGRSASSGKLPVMSREVRLRSRRRPSSKNAMARMPSHLSSKKCSVESKGCRARRASIGFTAAGRPRETLDWTTAILFRP